MEEDSPFRFLPGAPRNPQGPLGDRASRRSRQGLRGKPSGGGRVPRRRWAPEALPPGARSNPPKGGDPNLARGFDVESLGAEAEPGVASPHLHSQRHTPARPSARPTSLFRAPAGNPPRLAGGQGLDVVDGSGEAEKSAGQASSSRHRQPPFPSTSSRTGSAWLPSSGARRILVGNLVRNHARALSSARSSSTVRRAAASPSVSSEAYRSSCHRPLACARCSKGCWIGMTRKKGEPCPST